MRTHSITVHGAELPPIVSAALERIRQGHFLDEATRFTWTFSTAEQRAAVDVWLTSHNHSLANVAGTPERRFHLLVEMEFTSERPTTPDHTGENKK